jgi:hypothetical protein
MIRKRITDAEELRELNALLAIGLAKYYICNKALRAEKVNTQ